METPSETPSKKQKLQMNEDEDVFVKYKIPDETLEKIISYVPSKLNCFQVSKRFHRETIRATRGKCLVNLTPENVKSPSFMNIRFEFDEIRLANERMSKSFASKSLKFIEKFGFRIKKLLLYEVDIHTSDFLKLVRLMPNLIELHVLFCCVQKDYEQFLQSTPEPVGILELKLLKKLVLGDDELINSISLQMHSRTLKDVEIFFAAEAQPEIFREFRQCRLERISIDVNFALASTPTQILQLIESQPQLKSLQLSQDIHQEELQFKIFTPESLRSISNLKHLKTLDMRIFNDTLYPHSIVCKMMQMPKLKSLTIALENDELFNSMLSVRNEQLQSLSFDFYSKKDVGISRIADNFPNLKHLELWHRGQKVNVKFIDRLKKLESLRLSEISLEDLDELEVNESVRFLVYEPKPKLIDSVGLKLVEAMPNIEKFALGAPSTQLFEQILSLQNLVEIRCSSNYLLKDEVIACIKNRPQSSKLQRITFNHRPDLSERVVETFRNQFPIKRIKYPAEEVTLSRI